ncbi:ion transporter [Flavihumibacter profundi]|uniref:ion transporter n=1 Tax=Flavihumibacter profundi TaxID=2716883 RepID=UPI001CC33F44|nr:ion transporter [Flavihumibacter profundi]MBZ5857523.1 ion transporter [Flavihumibacter profundi]
MKAGKPARGWREKLFTIIFESDTRAGRNFDLALLFLILVSLVLVMLQSIESVHEHYGPQLNFLEWTITIVFTIEYILRLLTVKSPLKFMVSFYGIVDLLAILPTYLGLFLPGSHFLIAIRALRLIRIFRILKLSQFVREGAAITLALKASARRIFIFLCFVVLLSIILGALIYVVESGSNESFSSIPQSIYWAIVTITTVGYGDISPVTPIGKLIASCIMLLGYAILAVPTGIVTIEMSKSAAKEETTSKACPNCGNSGHDPDAGFCKYCGGPL